MTTPTPSAAEIERLVEWIDAGRLFGECGCATCQKYQQIAAALRAIPDLIVDTDNDRSRYKAQIERLERERDEALRMLAEAQEAQAVAEGLLFHALRTATPTWDDECQTLANRAVTRHASRLAAKKEKPDAT